MTFGWMDADPSAMPSAAKRFLDGVRSNSALPTHFLISCGKHKQPHRSRAAELYTSPRFRLSVELSERLGFGFSVISAKHGVLEPDSFVEPYDQSLSSLSHDEKRTWADNVLSQLLNSHGHVRRFVLLTDDDYRDDLSPLLQRKSYVVVEPTLGLERSGRMSFLRQAHHYLDRESAIRSFYACFAPAHAVGSFSTLREAVAGSLPAQGVYFFFDPDEPTRFANRIPRLVRIGTHGVSRESKATLRDRLRAHLGTADGYGNHRASVFRLHVGEAIIRKDNLRARFPEWGKNQNAERAITEGERELERLVTSYISRLQVQCIEVADRASKNSARSTIERLSIALFTERLVPVEPPGSNWLGLHSAHESIVRTGLWNVRDTGKKANFQVIDLILNRLSQSRANTTSDLT